MKKIFLSILFLSVVYLLLPLSQTYAEEKINSFVVDLFAHQDGTLNVDEEIQYDFGNQQHHGIYRDIPIIKKIGNKYQVFDISVDVYEYQDQKPQQYTTNLSQDTQEIKIGNPNLTISGLHTYSLLYNVKNAPFTLTDHDEINWNVTGNDWQVPIATASATLGNDFSARDIGVKCFTGPFGSEQSNCVITTTPKEIHVWTTQPLASGEGLTVVAEYPPHTFATAILQDKPPMDPTLKIVLAFLIPSDLFLNLILAPILLFWYLRYKHPKRFGPPAVNFDIPKDVDSNLLSPAEVGTIDNTKLDKDDLIATIFNLARRKYISITEIEKKKTLLSSDSADYELMKLKNDDGLTLFERKLLFAIFGEKKRIKTSDMTITYNDFADLEISNFASLKRKKIYRTNPKSEKSTLRMVAFILLGTGSIFLGPLLFFFSFRFNGRTMLGDKLNWEIDGLKIFLKNMSKEYKWQAKNMVLVEQMIPYAIALGYIDEFMKQLLILNPKYQPRWYTGHTSFVHSVHSFNTSVGGSITTTVPSSSGGFSGGGGGGGGGGSW